MHYFFLTTNHYFIVTTFIFDLLLLLLLLYWTKPCAKVASNCLRSSRNNAFYFFLSCGPKLSTWFIWGCHVGVHIAREGIQNCTSLALGEKLYILLKICFRKFMYLCKTNVILTDIRVVYTVDRLPVIRLRVPTEQRQTQVICRIRQEWILQCLKTKSIE